MNVVKLMGGLGNQLFQYAFGQMLQERYGRPIFYSVEWYERHKIAERPYLLDKFLVSARTTHFLNTRTVAEGIINLESYFTADNILFHGYWQDPKWYDDRLLEKLRQEFHVKSEYHNKEFLQWRDMVRSTNAIALHVRRGDYVGHQNHLLLPLRYYQNALMYMAEMKNEPEVFIFSDDLMWCREHFDGCHLVDLPSYLCFELMRECKHFIISNSTFSWWPAYLSRNATIIAPNQWAKDRKNGALLHEERMLVRNWLKIGLS